MANNFVVQESSVSTVTNLMPVCLSVVLSLLVLSSAIRPPSLSSPVGNGFLELPTMNRVGAARLVCALLSGERLPYPYIIVTRDTAICLPLLPTAVLDHHAVKR